MHQTDHTERQVPAHPGVGPHERRHRSHLATHLQSHAASLGSPRRPGVIPESHFALTREYDDASKPLRKGHS